MINKQGQQILRHLDAVYENDQLESSVMLIPQTAQGPAVIRIHAKNRAAGQALADLPCDEQDILELIDLSYITRGSGAMLRISASGRRLVARDFAAQAESVPGALHVEVSGSVGQMSLSLQGPATISASTVNQNAVDVTKLLAGLAEAIDRSDLPEERKNDAKIETSQVALELSKSQKNPSRIAESLKALRELVTGSAALVEPLDQLADAIGTALA